MMGSVLLEWANELVDVLLVMGTGQVVVGLSLR